MKKGRLLEIINEVKNNNNLHFVITPQNIQQRLKRNNPLSITRGGRVSPLLPIEPMVVKVLIRLARIRECINPTTAMRLINSMITNTPLQEELITFKKSMRNVGTREQHETVSTVTGEVSKKETKIKL